MELQTGNRKTTVSRAKVAKAVKSAHEYKPTKEQLEGTIKAGFIPVPASKVKGWVPKGWTVVMIPDSAVVKALKDMIRTMKKSLVVTNGNEAIVDYNSGIQQSIGILERRIKKEQKKK